MAKFLAKVLAELDELYDIRDSRIGTDQLDLTGIQLVHDVAPGVRASRSRSLTTFIAQGSTGAGPRSFTGSFIGTDSITVAAGPPTVGTIDPWNAAQLRGISPREANCWLVDYSLGYGDTGNNVTGFVAVAGNAFVAAPPDSTWRVLETFNVVQTSLGGAGLPDIQSGSNFNSSTPRWDRRPVRLHAELDPSGAADRDILYYGGTLGGAVARDLTLRAEFLFTPKNVRLDVTF